MTDGWMAVFNKGLYICLYIGGLVQDCGISSVDALEIPQSWTKLLIYLMN